MVYDEKKRDDDTAEGESEEVLDEALEAELDDEDDPLMAEDETEERDWA